MAERRLKPEAVKYPCNVLNLYEKDKLAVIVRSGNNKQEIIRDSNKNIYYVMVREKELQQDTISSAVKYLAKDTGIEFRLDEDKGKSLLGKLFGR